MIITAEIDGVQVKFMVVHHEWRSADRIWVLTAALNDVRVFGTGATLEDACDHVVATVKEKGDPKCKHKSVTSGSVEHGVAGVCITCRMPMRRDQKKWIAAPVRIIDPAKT